MCPKALHIHPKDLSSLLGGSWVVVSGVISLLIWVIAIVTLLITSLITTHEPPSIVSTGQATGKHPHRGAGVSVRLRGQRHSKSTEAKFWGTLNPKPQTLNSKP